MFRLVMYLFFSNVYYLYWRHIDAIAASHVQGSGFSPGLGLLSVQSLYALSKHMRIDSCHYVDPGLKDCVNVCVHSVLLCKVNSPALIPVFLGLALAPPQP